MATTPMTVAPAEGIQPEESKGTIRLILADTQAIFRAGLRKIFALEDDIRVIGQAESLGQTLAAIQKFTADILIFEAALTANPPDTVTEILRQSANCRLVVVLQEPDQEMTLELVRRGAHAVVACVCPAERGAGYASGMPEQGGARPALAGAALGWLGA